MLDIKFDNEKCVRCGACIDDCPVKVIKRSTATGAPEITGDDKENCLGCEHCYAVCPAKAVSIYDLNPEVDSVPLGNGVYLDHDKMENLLRGRRSIRNYKQENVDNVLLNKLLLAAANCPTAGNNLSLKFDVIADINSMNELRNELMSKLISYYDTGGFQQKSAHLGKFLYLWKEQQIDVIFRTAPHVLLVSAPMKHPLCSIVDVSIALSYFELIAQSNGIGTTWCGLLKMALELFPEYKSRLMDEDTGDYYCMLFGYPVVNYVRTVNRDHLATIRYR